MHTVVEYKIYSGELKEKLNQVVPNTTAHPFEVKLDPELDPLLLRSLISQINSNPVKINNRNLIDHLLKSHSDQGNQTNSTKNSKLLVILVQVHARIGYLNELIESMRITKHIEESLVIFSHDVYSPEMNKLIRGINFCAVNIKLLMN
jgi:hypothetical protein